MSEFTELVTRLIADGADPNELHSQFEEAVKATLEWALWGDMRWRRNMVCSKCGSSYAGICSDDPKVRIMNSKNPVVHKNQIGVTRIPYREWLQKVGKGGGNES